MTGKRHRICILVAVHELCADTLDVHASSGRLQRAVEQECPTEALPSWQYVVINQRVRYVSFQLGCSSPVIAKDPLIVVFLIPAFVRLFRRPSGSCFIPEAKLGHAAWHIDWISTRVWGQLRAFGVRRRGTQFSARASTAPPSFVAIKRGWAAICCRQASKAPAGACDMPAKMAGAPSGYETSIFRPRQGRKQYLQSA